MEYRCPYCGNRANHIVFCKVCEHKVEWVKEIIQRSNAYYNKGYYAATQRDLSLAIYYLKKAIELNKYNTCARNLLGLVLFEIGKVGDALKEWIISHSLNKEDPLAETYINRVQKAPKKLVSYKEATHLYNKAIEYLKQNNTDVAMIRLKKAVSINPHFVEAKVLLGLCYIVSQQFYKANEHIKAALLIDKGHHEALLYFKELGSKDTEFVQPYEIEYVSKVHSEKKIKPIKVIDRGITLRYSMLYLVIGIFSMFIIYHFLVLPNQVTSYKQQVAKLTEQQNGLDEQLNETLKENALKMSELEATNKKLLAEKGTYEQQVSSYLQKDKLKKAEEAVNEGEYVEAAKLLYNIAPSLLEQESKGEYETLKEACYLRAATTLYNEGYQLYQDGKYIEGKAKLETALIYEPTEDIIRRCIYYLGMSELELKNTTSAEGYFNKVIAEYPDTYEASLASEQLSQMQS